MSRAAKIALLLLYAAQIIVIHRETLKPLDVGAAERLSQTEKPLARIFSGFRAVIMESETATRLTGRRIFDEQRGSPEDKMTPDENTLSEDLHRHSPEKHGRQTWFIGRNRHRADRLERLIANLFPATLRLVPATTATRAAALPRTIAAYSARRLVVGVP